MSTVILIGLAMIVERLEPANKNKVFSIVVVGGGITGLTAAYRLCKYAQARDIRLQVSLLESSGRTGGVIGTFSNKYGLIEQGPESFVTHKPAALELVNELGLSEKILPCSKVANKTFVFQSNVLHPLPDGFIMFAPTKLAPLVTSKLFSWAGKLRMAGELVLPAKKTPGDESLADFVHRRLGREVLERLAEPLLAGIYSTPPEHLSASCAVPKLCEFEQKHGSIIKGLINSRLSQPKECQSAKPPFLTLDAGMQLLPDSLARALPTGCLRLNTKVSAIVAGVQRRWSVKCSDGTDLDADAVIIATPTAVASRLLRQACPAACTELNDIESGSASSLSIIFRSKDIDQELNGSGFVVSAREGRIISACSFSSIKFGGRAAADHVLLRVFTRANLNREDPEYEKRLLQLVMPDLRDSLKLRGAPVFCYAPKSNGIPRYVVGHKARVERIMGNMRKTPGLFLAGNSYNGIGIPDCINSATLAANAASAFLFPGRIDATQSAT